MKSPTEHERDAGALEDQANRPDLTPAARRALAEAAARRAIADGGASVMPEIGGPATPEPTRYGDWERKGIASDF